MDKLIVNPRSNKGRAAALLPGIIRHFRQLGLEFEVQKTEAPGQAKKIAQQAALHGYRRVIAVGGDGTCYEIVNGLLSAAQEEQTATLGIIPTGSGNDLAHSLGIPPDIAQACSILKNGSERAIDVGQVTVDNKPHVFVNCVGLGLDAEVALTTPKTKLMRGFPMYLGSVLWVIAFGGWPYQAKFSFNAGHYQQSITLITVANGQRSGGGFFLTPDAKLDDGLLDICYASKLSKFQALSLLPKTLKGTHIHHQAVTLSRSNKIEISVAAGIPGHIDGEILCVSGQHFSFEILPRVLRVWA
jgi:YegS/Rv2252/BmrU family lipid kinase